LAREELELAREARCRCGVVGDAALVGGQRRFVVSERLEREAAYQRGCDVLRVEREGGVGVREGRAISSRRADDRELQAQMGVARKRSRGLRQEALRRDE